MWMLTSLLLLAAPADKPKIERLLVLNLAPSGVDTTVARTLSEMLARAIRDARSDVSVMGQAEIDAMLAVEKQRDVLGCEDNVACLAEIGGALGADHMVAGSVGKVGAVYVLTLKLINAEAASTVRHISEDVEGAEERLIEATRQWGANLVDPERPAAVGVLDVRGAGDVTLDGAPLGPAPVRRHTVTPGRHRVAWRDAGGGETVVMAEVAAYATVRVEPGGDAASAAAAPQAAPRRDLIDMELRAFSPARRLAEGGSSTDDLKDFDSSDFASGGSGSAAGWGMALRLGLRGGESHQVFAELDRAEEKWMLAGPYTYQSGAPGRTVEGTVRLPVYHLLLGYRFSYPVRSWLEPFAELGVGLKRYGTGSIHAIDESGRQNPAEVHPRTRNWWAYSASLGARLTFLEHWFAGVSAMLMADSGSTADLLFAAGAGGHY